MAALEYRTGFWSQGVMGLLWSLAGVIPLWVALEHRSELAGWKRWLPGVQMLARYEPAWLAHDLMAGLVLTTMLVPVGSDSTRPATRSVMGKWSSEGVRSERYGSIRWQPGQK